MNETQLELFSIDDLPRLNDTEEALVYYMRKCMQLETELKELKDRIGDLHEITH